MTSAAMSAYERRSVVPRPEVEARLCTVLCVPATFFRRPFTRIDAPIRYRSLSAATKRARSSAEARAQWLREIIDDRHGSRSTVIASQLPVGKWHDHLGDPTIADAVLDRVVHNAHRIALKGPTRRKTEENATKS